MDSTDVRRQWKHRSGEFSPEYYAYYGPDETSERIRRRLERHLDRGRDATVLELGCSSGRHLSHLHANGFENLAGLEMNAHAFDVMEDAYPDLADDGTFYLDAIEDAVEDFEDDQFDAVYSVETLQHLHPDAAWVFDELSRIAGELLITAENEGNADPDSDSEPDSSGSDSSANRTPDRAASSDPDVNYVNDEFPLYYRDWNGIFTDRGCTELDATEGRRDTIRTFRTSSD
ncbi:class I SAM-dependent methyltransferase [Halopiger xanaduensis]|uniref:Methyltransferase type 11 n=1 Tax=Halopiger xanaduensis (strain DSM 18323 / JCM 14033 / SH-6) TaxID=797210 RepID=F8D6T9_HALXS|nr:class I SAM-dependent methyltransferase [Halopiger xanaduensis]AEH35763.1 Methyltransferase type 11 [Halopiger xanaduensis SH-6]